MRLNITAPILFVSALSLLASCSARPERFVEEPTEEVNASGETKSPEAKGIEPLAPIEYIEGDPDLKVIGSLGTTQVFQVGDITVIHKVTPANAVVAVRLYIRGGATNLTTTTSGIEQLALSVATSGGTLTTPKDDFNGKLDAMGASVFSFAGRDNSGYGFKSLVDHFPETWNLFEQAVIEPAMPAEEVELQRSQQLAEIKGMLEDPDSHLVYVATRNFFEGHPYSQLQVGTEENVKSFTQADVMAYQRSLLRPERMVLVVVGNVSAKDVLERVKASFGRIKNSEDDQEQLPPFSSAASVRMANRDLPTNYVIGYFAAPKPGHPDYPATVVAMEYLKDKLFEEVRTKRNLTYAVSAGIGNKLQNYGYLYVTASDPRTTMGVIFDQVEEMKLITIPKSELDEVVNVFLTDHYMGLETNGGQASMLAEAQLIAGDWKHAAAFLPEIRGVSPDDVKRVAQKYFTNYRFGVVGPKSQLEEKYFTP